MKNLVKILGIIAIVAMVGFTLASCGGGAGAPAEVPEIPDDTVWETVIYATDTTNGYQEAVSGLKAGDIRELYAIGSAGGVFTVVSGGYSVDFSGADGLEKVVIPAKYNPTGGPDNKDFDYSKYADVVELIGVPSGATLVDFLPVDTSVNAKTKAYTVKKIGGIAASVKGTEYEKDEDDEYVYTFVIPKGVTEISDKAFEGNTGITDIVLPSTLKTIGASAFKKGDESSLAGTIYIPSSVTKIGESAFSGQSSVLIVVPASVGEVGASAFAGVSAITVTGASKEAPSGWAATFNGDDDEKVPTAYIP